MKIFIDSADVPTILKHFETGLIDGVTTNPTLIKKGGKDPEDVYRELSIAGIPDVSMEVVEDMTFEGQRLAAEYKDVCTCLLYTSPSPRDQA